MRSRLFIALAVVVAACSSGDSFDGAAADTVPATTMSPATTGPPATTPVETTVTVPLATTTTTTTTTTEPPGELLGVSLELVAEVHAPLVITAAPGSDGLFVAQRDGIVLVVEPGGEVRERPFLAMSALVKAEGVEQGFLGMAFHPDYQVNGRVFVHYTDWNDDTVLAELTADANREYVDVATERQLILFDQPTDRHNAGDLQFGPDGYLYVAVGDGGDGGHNGQKPETLFGTILRLDVDGQSPYAIPGDNPFVTGGGAAEVWAYGLRNPWRFSIDYTSGLMYIGDVGQADLEEIDVVSLDDPGANFGWIYREGSKCFRAPECRDVETVLPVAEYPHSEGCSVTGGVVYRGDAIPELDGVYFYADWCRGWVRSFRYEDGAAVDLQSWPELDPGQVNTFGTDAVGELYIGTWGGSVWKLVPVRAER
jgi:glucose/arabinose dehydrogenase